MTKLLRRLWSAVREVSGDDAYDRYLAHWHDCHRTNDAAPVDRAAFFKEEQQRKWNGLRRCC